MGVKTLIYVSKTSNNISKGFMLCFTCFHVSDYYPFLTGECDSNSSEVAEEIGMDYLLNTNLSNEDDTLLVIDAFCVFCADSPPHFIMHNEVHSSKFTLIQTNIHSCIYIYFAAINPILGPCAGLQSDVNSHGWFKFLFFFFL